MTMFRRLLWGTLRASTWPSYLGLMAYAARKAPWPPALGSPLAHALMLWAASLWAARMVVVLFGPGGCASEPLRLPEAVARQWRRALLALTAVSAATLVPCQVLSQGMVLPGDHVLAAPALSRLLLLVAELAGWLVVLRLVRSKSATVLWLAERSSTIPGSSSGWMARHRRLTALVPLAAIGAVIALEAAGFSLTSRRLALAELEGAALAGLAVLARWLIHRAIDAHAWRWVLPVRHGVRPAAEDDLAGRLRTLTNWAVPLATMAAAAWTYQVDFALFRSLGAIALIGEGENVALTLGDVSLAALAIGLTVVAWRSTRTVLTLLVFPRIGEDEGVRFAVLSLVRYAILAAGVVASLSALKLGLERLGVILAALGVGVGFGLQEIVANFVSGLILLIERPIRVGDVVTVAGMSGRVDRIHIRATTIINWDNQSIIVPNREFITGNLTNWTHRDRIVRLVLNVGAAYGTDPEKVTELMLAIAREDADVLRNPVPTAFFESFGESSLNFTMYVHVGDPSLIPRVRHNLHVQIRKRFETAGIRIPYPTREVVLSAAEGADGRPAGSPRSWLRFDAAESTPTPPAGRTVTLTEEEARSLNRCVDE